MIKVAQRDIVRESSGTEIKAGNTRLDNYSSDGGADGGVSTTGEQFQEVKSFLRLLPYYDSLQKETESILEKIIRYLGKAVLRHDFLEGVVVATKQLLTYVELYGLKFTKKQHISLVNLYLELLTMKTCPLNLIYILADMLKALLNKPWLLTRDDLSIPWRPLYETLQRCRHFTITPTVKTELKNTLYETIWLCNKYWEKGTFPEVVAELKPLLCPSSSKMEDALLWFKYFTPYADPDAEKDVGKFLEELWEYYVVWSNLPKWEWNMVALFAATAWYMPRSFDWTPHLPMIYARLIKNLDLPVYLKEYHPINSNNSFVPQWSAQLIVSTMGNNKDSMFHFKNFINSLETFLHPSCQWRTMLVGFLDHLVAHFIERVKIERYHSTSWWCRWPEDKKLTDEDIDDFVNVIRKVMLELYLNAEVYSTVIFNLALMRPQLIIPEVMEKYSEIVDTVTEHEKYISVVRWAGSSLVAMLKSSSWKMDPGYDGRHLMLPFLKSLLTAIDPNDIPKTVLALSRLTNFVFLIPLVDCSALADEAETQYEKKLCRATAGVEELVLQILECVLSLIQCRNLEDTRMMDDCDQQIVFDEEDESLEGQFWDLFLGIANFSSTKIFQSVATKLVRIALTSTMETEVSGRLFTGIVQAFAVARPDIILPMMLTQLCASIENLVTDDMLDEEELDPELLFQLLLLSRILGTNGKELLKYSSQIEATLATVLKLNGKKGYEFAGNIITSILESLVNIYPQLNGLPSRISNGGLDDPRYMAIGDWGSMVEAKSFQPTWHIPSDEELQWAKRLFLRIFTEHSAKFEVIDGCTEEQEEFNKSLLKNTNILLAAYDGMSALLKFWDVTPLDESLMDLTVSSNHCGIPDIEIVSHDTGENIMLKYYKLYCTLQKYLENFKPDDIDAFYVLAQGFFSLLVPNATLGQRSYSSFLSENVVNPNKVLNWTRSALLMKMYSQHLNQIEITTCVNWTHGHLTVLQRLFELCVDRYVEVRLNAQDIFFDAVNCFDFFEHLIPRAIQPLLIEKLQEGVPHDEFKGALYIMSEWNTLMLNNGWQDLCDLWTALIKSPFSEKVSINGRMTAIRNLVILNFIHLPFKHEVPSSSRLTQFARELVSKKELEEMDTTPFPNDAAKNQEHYVKLVQSLIEVANDSNSHWRKRTMASDMLSVLLSVDSGCAHVTEDLIAFYFNGLVSTIFQLRESAIQATSHILKFFQLEYPRVTIDVEKDLDLAPGQSIHSILKYTSTNKEIKYKIKGLPTATPLYVHKDYHGFAAMPATLAMKQPVTDFKDLSTLTESRQIVLKTTEKFLTDEDYVTKLMEFWSHEKQELVNSWSRVIIVKGIARNNGPQALRLLLKCARQFGVDKDKWKQRCASDVLCGIMRGLKLWDDEMVSEFWKEHLKPVFTECLDSVTQETTEFWKTAIYRSCYNRDPNKLRFFIQFLKERFIGSLNTAQITSVDVQNEMTFYKQAFSLLHWRGGEEYVDILSLVKTHFFDTANPYMIVRVEMSLLLTTCLEWDIEFSRFTCDLFPKYEPFIKFIFQSLENLEKEAVNYQADVNDCEVNEEIRQLLLKFKTVLKWVMNVCLALKTRTNHNVFTFIPLLCQFESFQADPEVAILSGYSLADLARTQIHPKYLDQLLDILKQAAGMPSWKARVCVLEYVKVFALNNISILTSNERWTEEVRSLVMKLLFDRKMEVRETAYKILSGFLHCVLIKDPMNLLSEFQRNVNSFANKPISPEDVDALHSSILGLCAFVEANPYQIPQYLPNVLVSLTMHLHDPQPIPATIRKCLLDFRHRHQDDWDKHKTKFTEDQLSILNDVFVSPNYYV